MGGEFRVNTTTANRKSFSSVAALSDGGFVVTWTSEVQDGSGSGIYGQRYDAAGALIGAEFRVNTTTASNQSFSSVAALSDGGFVVTWSSVGQDGSGVGIYGQRYDAAGAVFGAEFQVNTTTANDQDFSSVAALSDGGFVVTWDSSFQDGSLNGIYGQRYDIGGMAVGGETLLNQSTIGNQFSDSLYGMEWVAMLENGDIVVTWQGDSAVPG